MTSHSENHETILSAEQVASMAFASSDPSGISPKPSAKNKVGRPRKAKPATPYHLNKTERILEEMTAENAALRSKLASLEHQAVIYNGLLSRYEFLLFSRGEAE
jgi:hypothetical protein